MKIQRILILIFCFIFFLSSQLQAECYDLRML